MEIIVNYGASKWGPFVLLCNIWIFYNIDNKKMILSEENKKRLKCKEWRLNHLYKIIDKMGNLVTFKCNTEQNKLLSHYIGKKQKKKGLREYILKDRQIGITTFHVLYYLDEVIFNKNRTCAIIAHEKDALERIFRKAKLALENLPPFLIPRTTIENKREMMFQSQNSSIYIALKVRSGTVHHLHVSELALIKEYKELKAGSFSTVPMFGDITCESTARGLNGFYKDWVNNKTSPIWKNHFFSWLEHKDYTSKARTTRTDYNEYLAGKVTQGQKNWFYQTLETLGNDFDLMKQEYPLNEEDAFIHSGKGLFMEELKGLDILEGVKVDNWFTQYEKPKNGEEYCIGADTALGHKDGDASVFYIINNRTWNVSGVFSGRLAPDLYGKELIKWAEIYNMAFLGIEENNSGIAVINTVKEEYTNLYQRERRDKVTEEITAQLGWYTNQKSKDEIISTIKQTLREKTISSIPIILKDELSTFVLKDSGKREAMSGCHDDHVMAFGIALMMVKHNPYFDYVKKPTRYMGRIVKY